ncbi:MAG: PstS family phosphate ABC transporter substrate-binding protein [Planctomycetes bacterium]|nr:PstS family phosphate ABC transporter substrate-binding protein [Planctomycetota bacterium]
MRTPLAVLAVLLPWGAACVRGTARYTEVRNLGSDTMLEVAGAWAEAYDKVTDHIVVSVSGGGSGTGIAALIVGKIDLANSSRKLKKEELARAEKRGQHPVEHKVGYDGIAIFVHRDNPLPSISMAQLKALFGDGGEVTRWSQLGVDLGDPKLDPIVLVSRQNNSGTYEYFREAVLGGSTGRFKLECMNLNGSKDVVDFCGKAKSAIGYSGLAYANEGVRVVPVTTGAERGPVAPNNASIIDGSYPIARPLFMYTNGAPQGATKEYLDWILSDAGQRVLMEHGYPPLRPL